MFRKIITYFLIIAVAAPIIISGVISIAPSKAYAITPATAAPKYDSDEKLLAEWKEMVGYEDYSKSVKSPCYPLWNIASGPCVKYLVSNLFYLVFFWPSYYLVYFAGTLFDTAIVFSISGQAMDTSANSMIAVGWTTIRDLINLFFIFILLYAAISTILQYGNYQLKNVLAKIIIAALLINFSLMIGKMVIDASHILAWEFYNRIDVNDTANEAAKAAKKAVEEEVGETEKLFPEVKGDINVKIEEGIIFGPRKLSEVFLAGFNPQRLITASTGGGDIRKEDAFQGVVNETVQKGGSSETTWFQLIIIILLASVLNVVAAFILLAGGIMFIIRIVVLWLVLIFSPVAFLGIIAPNFQKYSNQWLDTLIKQAFFAPAFLFMFALITKFVNSGFMDKTLSSTKGGAGMSVLYLDPSSTIMIAFNFFVIGFLMVFSLTLAKQMGGKAASFGLGGANRIKGWALGGANALVAKPFLRHTVGKVSSDMAKSGWAERMAAKSPTFGGWMKGVIGKGGDVGGFDKIMEQRIKTGQGLSTPALRAQYLKNLNAREQAEWYSKASARTRVELEDAAMAGGRGYAGAVSNMESFYGKLSLEEQEKTIKARSEVDLKKTDNQLADIFLDRSEEIQKEIINQMKNERKAGFIDKLYLRRGTAAGFATAVDSTTLLGNNIRKFRPDLINTSTLPGVASLEEAVKNHKPEDILLLNKDIANNPEVITEMIKSYKGGHVNKIIERGDELYTKFKDELKSISGGSNSVSVVVGNLQRVGNPALASLIQSNEIMQKSLGLV